MDLPAYQSPTPGHWYVGGGHDRDHMLAAAAAAAARRQADELVHLHRRGEECGAECLVLSPDGTRRPVLEPTPQGDTP